MDIKQIKELISNRAKDLGLSFDFDDIVVIKSGNVQVVWLKRYNQVDNTLGIDVDMVNKEYTVHLTIPQLAFILWDTGLVYDKIKSFTLPESIKV